MIVKRIHTEKRQNTLNARLVDTFNLLGKDQLTLLDINRSAPKSRPGKAQQRLFQHKGPDGKLLNTRASSIARARRQDTRFAQG